MCDEFVKRCFSVEEVQAFLCRRCVQKMLIVATNLPFDFFGFVQRLQKQKFRCVERNGIIYNFTFYQKNDKKRGVRFYDTMRFFPASVATLGKIVKVPKHASPSFLGAVPKTYTEWKELTTYCDNDAYISFLFMRDFVLRYIYDQGLTLKSTIASVALSDFRTNYLDETIPVESHEKHELAFSAYYGGRTEVFRRGEYKDVVCYDFNSLYPTVMCKPVPNPKYGYVAKKLTLYDIEHYEGVCYVEGWQEPTFIPLLPVRIKHDGAQKLVFPCGRIKGYYTFCELREAQKHGFTIEIIKQGVYYTRTKSYFKEFVLDKYTLRLQQKKEDNPMQIMTKLTMNSLYGKFGFNYRESSEIKTRDEITNEVLKRAISIDELGGGYFAINSRNERPTNYSFPIWAAYITAYARLHLYEKLKEYDQEVLYCDTDSLFFADNLEIPHGKDLGQLDKEYSVPFGIFVRPKFYFTKRARIKGVKAYDLQRDEFLRLVKGEEITQEQFVKFRTALRSKAHHKFGKLDINEIIKRSKRLRVEDTKRNWLKPFDPLAQETSAAFLFEEEHYQ